MVLQVVFTGLTARDSDQGKPGGTPNTGLVPPVGQFFWLFTAFLSGFFSKTWYALTILARGTPVWTGIAPVQVMTNTLPVHEIVNLG